MSGSSAQRGWSAAAVVSASMTAAWLEAAVGISTGPDLFEALPGCLMSLGVTALVLLLAAMPCLLAVRLLAGRGDGARGPGRALSVGVFLGTAIVLASMARVLVWPLYNADLLRWAVILFVSLPAALACWRIGDRLAGSEPGGVRLARVLFIVPFLTGLLFLVVWWTRYHVESILSAAALAGAIGGAVAAALLVAATLALRSPAAVFRLHAAVLVIVVAVPAAVILSGAEEGTTRTPAPHGVKGPERVVLISVDTLRADALSVYGDRGTSTPAIDSVAREGAVFTEAFTVSPWTLPSAATLLTGMHPDVHGMRAPGARLPAEITTLAERMQAAGYRTAAIGANPHLGRASGLDRGFDEYVFRGGVPPFIKEGPFGAKLLQRLFPPAFPSAGTTDELTDRAVTWLEANRDAPFFLWIHFLDPHVPHTPPGRHQPAGPPPAGMGMSFARQNAIRSGHYSPSRQEREWIGELYLAEVRYVDESIGRILATLKNLGLDEGTLLIITADHGEEHWEHGGYEHGHSLHRETLRIPLIVRSPGRGPLRIDTPVSIGSILPTILDLCGLPYERQLHSRRSLRSRLDGEQRESFHPIVSTALLYGEDMTGVRFGSWLYVRPAVTARQELYDLAADPDETASVAALRPETVELAESILRAHEEGSRIVRETLSVQGATGEIGDETIQQLRSLGYIE